MLCKAGIVLQVSVCVSVCLCARLFAQKLKHYWSKIDATLYGYALQYT